MAYLVTTDPQQLERGSCFVWDAEPPIGSDLVYVEVLEVTELGCLVVEHRQAESCGSPNFYVWPFILHGTFYALSGYGYLRGFLAGWPNDFDALVALQESSMHDALGT